MHVTCSILCYNYGRFLSQAIESCLNQGPADYTLDIIVIDDGSTDETPEICRKYKGHVRVIRSSNMGFGASLDRAISEASGDYVCLLDADDYYTPEMVATILPCMQKGYLYIEHSKFMIDEDGHPLESIIHQGGSTSTLCLQRLAALTLLPVQNEIFFHPLNLAGHGIIVNQPLSYYRVHKKSMINNNLPGQWYLHHAKVVHALVDQLLTNSQSYHWANSHRIRKISKKYRATAFQDEMEGALQVGQRKVAIQACLKSIWYATFSPAGLKMRHGRMLARSIIGRPMRPPIIQDAQIEAR